MATLLFAEVANGHLADITARALTAALELGAPVDVLIAFLDDVERDNIFVNFDPANMILYGAGEPIPAIEALGLRIHSAHCAGFSVTALTALISAVAAITSANCW